MKTTATQSHSPEKNRILRIRISDNGTTVPFGEKDVEMFDRLFRIVDSNDDGVIEGALGAAFLRRSKLSDETLREVWRLACGGKSRPSMTREAWFLAMKMVAMAQQSDLGECPSLEDLAGESVLYTATPNFGFGIEHVVEKTNENRISPDDARIRVQNPSTQSSAMGIRGHTMYEIFTKTTLKHFVFKQMRVRRRFKEFEWLRRRLSRRYIGLVIPKLPAKRLYVVFTHSPYKRKSPEQHTHAHDYHKQTKVRKYGSPLYRGETNGASTLFELYSSTSSNECVS